MTRYRTIVADPPWPIGDFPPMWGYEKGKPLPYDTMPVAEIAALPIKRMSDNRDGDAHLYLWTINDHLEASYGVARAWGFHPVAVLTWCKPPRPGGLGGAFPSNTEFILFCRRPGYVSVETREPRDDVAAVTRRISEIASDHGFTGRDLSDWVGASDIGSWWTSHLPKRCAIPSRENWAQLRERLPALAELDDEVERFNAKKGTVRKPAERGPRADGRWFTWPVAEHSRKPEAFLDIVEQVSSGPYLELFARRQRLGWDTWGNEALEHVDLGGEHHRRDQQTRSCRCGSDGCCCGDCGEVGECDACIESLEMEAI